MKTNNRFRSGFVLLGIFSLLFFNACRTTPKADWDSRIGTYTYQDAVAELGPPDKEAELPDGTLVAEWQTETRPRTSVGVGFGVGRYGPGVGTGAGVGVSQPVGSGAGHYLRLTFDQERKLIRWNRQYQ